MSAINLSYGAYKRTGNPEAVLLNCYVEKAPTQAEEQFAIRARAGLTAFKAVGSGAARGLAATAGLFDDQMLVPVQSTLYGVSATGLTTTFSGALGGTGRVDMALGQDASLNSVVRIATGDNLYQGTAGVLTIDNFAAATGAGASSVCYHRGFWLAVAAGTDQVFYQVPGDTAWTALSFASAEYSPDPLVAVRSRGDQIMLMGSATVEAWALTGSASPAIQPYGGLNFDHGCLARDAAVNVAGALLYVDSNCQVRMFEGGQATIISDNGLTEQIEACDPADLRASGYTGDGHTFYQLTLGAASTWAYDLSTQEWHTRSSLGKDYLTAHLYASIGQQVFAVNSLSNQMYVVDASAKTDAGANFSRTLTAFAEVLEGQIPCANVELICETGAGPYATDPVVSMRFSDDGAKTWSRWFDRPLGETGQYSTRVRWNALGTMKAPYGRVFQFRVTDPALVRASGARVNAP